MKTMKNTVKRSTSMGARTPKSTAPKWPGATAPAGRTVSKSKPGYTTPGFKPGSRRSKI